jgi:release factor glutamine methyltransferase
MQTIVELLAHSENFLKEKGVSTAKLDAELLLSHVLRCNRSSLVLNRLDGVSEALASEFKDLVVMRGCRRPLQYLIGEVDFHGLSLIVEEGVLIPRHETEELVDIIISRFQNHSVESILDLGTGTGAIGLTLARYFPRASVSAIDTCDKALGLAKKNAKRNNISNITFIKSDWLNNIHEKFDMIVSNPPYLTPEEFLSTQDEIRKFEPQSALVSGEDGLTDIFEIIETSSEFLNANGVLALETGNTQHQKIENFSKSFFQSVESIKDLCGQDRFIFLHNNCLLFPPRKIFGHQIL